MINKKSWMIIIILAAAIFAAIAFSKPGVKPPKTIERRVKPVMGTVQSTISSTATVLPQNRLEIKPPISGRIDKILVQEGDKVKVGQTLVWMSSTERAALLDAARARGPEAMKYWEGVYKPTPLVSPIDGDVIVSKYESGQVVTSADAVLVLSDRLIVQAQVDETDIGRIRLGQEVIISLDAYPKIRVKGIVDHIYYESTIVNNVTVYHVDIVPETVPEVFRSGMTATVTITEKAKENAMLVPLDSVKKGPDGTYVKIVRGIGSEPEERKVELGISDDKNTEVLSGLSEEDEVLVTSQKYELPSGNTGGNNPLMPFRQRRPGK